MNLDFTLAKYRELCQCAVLSGYMIKTVAAYLQDADVDKNILIMRHDVDRSPAKALRMAKLEYSLGIKTTYYFRKSGFARQDIIKAIAELGHEIGYHYETLDKARGDHLKAIQTFEKELTELRNIADVSTICMHGNPLTRWLNRDLWKYYDYHELGIIGEAFLSMKDLLYFSDTGRTWRVSFKVKDKLPPDPVTRANELDDISTTNDLIRFIENKGCPEIYICIHPERWNSDLFSWLRSSACDGIVNLGKLLIYRSGAS